MRNIFAQEGILNLERGPMKKILNSKEIRNGILVEKNLKVSQGKRGVHKYIEFIHALDLLTQLP